MPVISAQVRTARKGYWCPSCRKHAIAPGDKYLRLYGNAYGYEPPYVLRSCLSCCTNDIDPKVKAVLAVLTPTSTGAPPVDGKEG